MTSAKPSIAEEIVAQALSYLVANEPMLTRFFNLTGLAPDTIREAAKDPGFYASVLDHFLADEMLLAQFTQSAGLRPEDVRTARLRLDNPEQEGGRTAKSEPRTTLPRKSMFR